MATIFTKIVEREIPAHIIAEDDKFLAFLDISPLTKGHSLVIPKKEVDYFFDLDDDLLREINIFSKTVARAIEKVIACERIGITVMGLEVPHAHVHLIPMNTMDDMNFSRMKLTFSSEELADIAGEIRAAYETLAI